MDPTRREFELQCGYRIPDGKSKKKTGKAQEKESHSK